MLSSLPVKRYISPTSGEVNRGWLIVFGVLAALVALLALWRPSAFLHPMRTVQSHLPKSQPPKKTYPPLTVLCADSQRKPMEEAARQYEQDTGVPVEVTFGASQTLLNTLANNRKGDLYIPDDEGYLNPARARNLIREDFPLARMVPRMVVAKGNPKNLHSLADLKGERVRLSQGNPDVTAIGKLVRVAVSRTGDWTALEKNTVAFKNSVDDVASDVQFGLADAGFVWGALAAQYPKLDFVELPEFASAEAHVTVAVCRYSDYPDNALNLAKWLSDPNQGGKIWQASGFAR